MKKIVGLILLVFLSFGVHASHIMGGEITWECIKDPLDPDVGKYIFTMKLYRDCDGISLPTTNQTLNVWNHPTVTTISLQFISNTDISPDCDVTNSGNPALDCFTNPIGAVEEYIYQSLPIALIGAPPISNPPTPTTHGWHFTWDSCCRNGAIVNLTTPNSDGFTMRASMFAYVDPLGNSTPTDPCFDSSPIFNESPKTIICTGYPFSYTHNASDQEMDSLVYSWDEPLDDFFGAYNPPVTPGLLTYTPPYTANNPLPGNPTLDPQNGQISYTSNLSGNFVTVVRVDAYKCDQLVAQIYREIQAVLIACPPLAGGNANFPPNIPAPFPAPTPYYTTVAAGTLVSFNISASDADLYAAGVPQDVSLEITGGQMAGDFITTTDCVSPPCATFTDNLGNPPPFSSPSIVNGIFEWQTACTHISSDAGCGNVSNIYNFAIKAYDDFCPANAITFATITIEVTQAASLPAPDLKCVFVNGNGDVTLDWNHTVGANNSTLYHLYASDNIGGPYVNVADVSYPTDNYTIDSSLVPPGAQYFFMTNESTCASESLPSDTITPIAFEISSNNVSCWDDADGSISVEVLTNMLNPFSYYINGVINPNPPPYDTLFSALQAGTYNITVSDNGYCQITQPIHITAPGFPLQLIISDTVNTCFGQGTANASVDGAGGTPPYSYEWFNFGDTIAFSTQNTVDSLSTGSYFVEIMDVNGCDTFTTVQVISSQLPLTASPQIYGVSCQGDSTGMIIADGGGSSPPYKYYWKDSSGDTIRYTGYMIGRDTLRDLPAGSYRLHIYDSQDCFEDYILTVGEPATSLTIDSLLTVSDIACHGDSVGSARMFVSGGMPNYSYVWESGETGLVATSLKAGYNTVSVTDDWGCTVEDSIQINENPLIESTVSVVQNVSCYGNSDGIASVTSSGGIPSYIYFWSNGHTGFSMPDTAYNLLFGSYYVTTRDALGCEVIDSIDISQPEPLSMEASEIEWISCYGANDGLANAYAWGGTAPYTFTWLPNGQQGDTVNTLTPGIHTVTVTDAKGCTASDTVFINEPFELFVDIDDAQTVLAYCVGVNTASLTAIASGGTPGYSYQWDDNSVAPQTTSVATDLFAGVYTITVTDSRGCTVTDSRDIDTVTNTMNAHITALNQYNGGHHVSCYGANDGKVYVSASGAHEPYSYQWFGPSGFSGSNDTINQLAAGIYSVNVSDTNNCMVNTSIHVTEPLNLLYSVHSSTAETCLGSCDGTVSLQLSGGTAPYVGIFTNNVTGHIGSSSMPNDSLITNVCSGSHSITLTDANGCSSAIINGGNNQVVVPFALSTTASIDFSSVVNVLCNSSATGSVSALNPITNNTNYSYSWENVNNPGVTVSSTTAASNLIAGTYVLLAHYSDSNNLNLIYPGCTSSDTVTISELPAVEISSNGIVAADCFGASTGSINAAVSGGTPPYTFSWLPSGGSSNLASNLSAGTYTLNVLDANQCSDVDTFMVSQPDVLNVSITENNYLLSVSSLTGGVPPYSYSWRESSTPNVSIQGGTSFLVTEGGNYYVIITDANGCTQTSNSVLFNETSIGEAAISEIKIYPNPFRDEATIDLGTSVSDVVVRVMDIYGKVIEIIETKNRDKVLIKSRNKAKGTYFVEIEIDEDQIFYKKLIMD